MPDSSSWSREGARLLVQEHRIRLVILVVSASLVVLAPHSLTHPYATQLSLLLMLGALLWARFGMRERRRSKRRLGFHVEAVALAVLDLAAVTLLLMGTGGAESGFFPLYLVSLIFAAILFHGLQLALLTALAAALYIMVSWDTLVMPEQIWHALARLLGLGVVSWYAYALADVIRRQQEARDQLLRHVSEGVLVFDRDERLVLVNGPMLRLLPGRSETALIGTHRASLADAGGLLAWLVADVGSEACADEGSTRVGSFPEAGLPLVECVTIACRGDREQDGWVVVCKNLQSQTAETRLPRNQTIEKLSPLSSLRALAHSLYSMAGYVEEPKRARAIDAIQRHTKALQGVLAEMLHDSYQAPPGSDDLDLTFVEVPSLLQGVRRLLQIAQGPREVPVDTTIADQLPNLSVDRASISQSLLHLCKGLVALAGHDDHLVIDVRTAGDYVRFALQLANAEEPQGVDVEGQAMSGAEAAEAFEGTEAFRIIEDHGGRWECVPQNGRVRRVVVELPIEGPRKAPQADPAEQASTHRALSEIAATSLQLNPVLAAEVSNQLKNSLNVIRGYAEMALKSQSEERRERALELAVSLSDQAAELVDSLQPSGGHFPHEEAAESTARHREASAPAVAPAVGGTILVVDDDPFMRQLLIDTLEDAGYTTAGADDGIEALNYIRATPPAILFVDLSMPGLSGVDVMREVRQRRPELPVVLMTGYTYNLAMQALGEEKPYAVIGKPFSINEVLAIVNELVGPAQPAVQSKTLA